MDYRYKGGFKPEENGYREYRTWNTSRYFYCDVYPGNGSDGTGAALFGNRGVRVRIVPYSVDSVTVAGWNGIFDILPFDSVYAVLDNGAGGAKPYRKALIALKDIRNNFLTVKE